MTKPHLSPLPQIFGSRGPAQLGRLTILSAGDKELFDECASCFAAVAKKAVFLGDVGNAGKLKTVLNLMDGIAMAGLAEAMALTEQVGEKIWHLRQRVALVDHF